MKNRPTKKQIQDVLDDPESAAFLINVYEDALFGLLDKLNVEKSAAARKAKK